MKNKICWVMWGDIFKPKDEEGLGIKDLKNFNMDLLAKWRWRFLNDDKALWKDVLKAKYGGYRDYAQNLFSRDKFKLSPLWWNNLCTLGKGLGNVEDWFFELANISIGNRESTFFWHDIWIGENLFSLIFLGPPKRITR